MSSPWPRPNDGATTREVAISPPGAQFPDFDWRLSVADIVKTRPFSCLPGLDRHFLMASAGSITLTVRGSERKLSFGSGATFRGESKVAVTDLNAPTRNLNLMTRAWALQRHDDVSRMDGPMAVGDGRGLVAVVVLSGGLVLDGDGSELSPLQILIPGRHQEHVTGRSALIASVHISRQAAGFQPALL